jgi:parallel beta-helix repeat protein
MGGFSKSKISPIVVVVLFVMASLAGSPLLATTYFNDGQVHNIDYEVEDHVFVDYQAPGMQTTVNMLGGGLITASLRGYEDSRMNILGGAIELDVGAYDRSQLHMSRASVGWSMWIYGGTQANISGGSIGYGMWVADSSQVHISGGSIGERLGGYGSSEGEIRSLTAVFGLEAYGASQVEISGGLINDKFALDDSALITIHGSDFAVDGEPFGYGELTSINGGYWRSEPPRHLTGSLANGQPIDNDFYIGHEARMILVYHPIRPPILLYLDDNAPNDPGPSNPDISDPCENGSKEHPYDAIQEAIDTAGYKDTILVADGTYTGQGNRDIDFLGKPITVCSENGPENCIIDCHTPDDKGCGFYFHSNEDADSVVDGITIKNGWVSWRHISGGYGAGIYCGSSSPTIRNNIIRDNRASRGGGIACLNHSSPIVENNTIADNYGSDTGGIYCGDSSMIVIGNIIRNNYGDCGIGGIGCFDSSAMIVNNLIVGNFPGDDTGGGIFSWDSSVLIENNTIVDNDYGGIVAYGEVGDVTVTNCIVRGHYSEEVPGAMTVRYSNVEGGYEGIGNIDADPCFADLGNRDYHLKSQAGRWDCDSQTWVQDDVTSPCIDAGDPMSPIGHEPFPNGGRVNMGAYGGTAEASKSYFGEPLCETIVAGDINGDCKVDFLDFRFIALHWLTDYNP